MRILDADGHELGVGPGRAGVRRQPSPASTATPAAAARRSIDGLLSSGDLGHFDRKGRLFIDGRDDDMIVSGGENVFPAEVEDLLATHPAVAEAAVIGVADEEFGQRLKAFVVRRPGPRSRSGRSRTTSADTSPATRCRGTVVFVDALPRTTTGKLRRRDLDLSVSLRETPT